MLSGLFYLSAKQCEFYMAVHSIHPFFRILILIAFAIGLQFASMWALLIVLLVMTGLLVASRIGLTSKILFKFRFLFCVILIVYAFNTPGMYVFNDYSLLNPTYEGLLDGAAQVMRLVLMLAALSLLTLKTSRNELMSGFYFLFYPLSFVGVDTARISARLWLTLHYAEVLQPAVSNNDDWVTRIHQRLALVTHDEGNQPEYVEIELNHFHTKDYLAFIGFVAIMSLLICVLR